MRRRAIFVLKLAGIHKRAWGALSTVVAFTCVDANGMNMSSRANPTQAAQKQDDKGQAAYLHADDRIRDLLNHPAFAGFRSADIAMG